MRTDTSTETAATARPTDRDPQGATDVASGSRALALVALLLLVLQGCGGQETASSSAPSTLSGDTPVVIISIDTLRSDRLPIYGYGGTKTPAIDALRNDGILFERAYAHINQTLPSHSSMLTGKLPTELGLRDNIGYRLADEHLTLSEVLRGRGYRTGAFVSSFVLRGDTGFAQGFDVFDDAIQMDTREQLGGIQRSGHDTIAEAISWLDSLEGDEPFFLFAHMYEPHAPYTPPEPYRSLYTSPYDGEVALADAAVGDLLDALERTGRYDDALILLVSDHGEGLLDHGEMDHLVFIYREIVQVPLVMKLPQSDRGGSSIAHSAQLIDIAPTVAALLGIDAFAESSGSNLLELDEHEERIVFSESNYPRIHLGWSDLASAIRGDYHLISGPDPELYNLREDPLETANIIRDRQVRPVFRELQSFLDGMDRTITTAAEVDPEVREQLAALGYVTSSTAGSADDELKDPKSRIGVLTDLAQAADLYKEGDYAGSAEAYRRVTAAEPRMVLAHQQLGRSLVQLDLFDEAVDVLRTAFELSGGSQQIALRIADLYYKLGDLDAAREHAELAKQEHNLAHHLLAQIALREGDLESAERHNRTALEVRGQRIGPLITQAAIHVKREQYPQAIELTQQAEREFGNRTDVEALAGLYFQRGTAQGHLGNVEGAKASYLREIEVYPQTLLAYSHLAFLFATQGQGEAVGRTLQQLVTNNPTPGGYAAAVEALLGLGDTRSAGALLQQARSRWPGNERLASLASGP